MKVNGFGLSAESHFVNLGPDSGRFVDCVTLFWRPTPPLAPAGLADPNRARPV
jgi:hypothetical protein